jgi:hypothetical protein
MAVLFQKRRCAGGAKLAIIIGIKKETRAAIPFVYFTNRWKQGFTRKAGPQTIRPQSSAVLNAVIVVRLTSGKITEKGSSIVPHKIALGLVHFVIESDICIISR